MTKVRWIGELAVFTVFGLLAFAFMVPFNSTLRVVLVLSAPLALVFVMPSVAHVLVKETAELGRSFTWWQGLWVLVLVSGLVFRLRDVQSIDAQPIDGWALFRIGVESIVGVILIGRLVSEKTRWLRALFCGLIGIMAIFVMIDLVSTVWSVRPAWTFYKSLEYLVDLSVLSAVIVTVGSADEFESFVNLTWTLLGLMLLTAWIGAVLDPADAIEKGFALGPLQARLTGLIPNISANSIGEYSAILGIVALCRLIYDPERKFDRRWYCFLFIAAMATLVFSQTRSAIGGFIFAALVLLVVTRKILYGLVVGAVGAMMGVILVLFTDFGNVVWTYLLRGHDIQQAQGLTGRVEWWQFGIQKFMERPLIGYGAYAGGRFVILPELGRYGTPDLHSSVVESLVDTGVWGPIVLLIAVVAIWWYLLRSIHNPRLELSENRLAMEASAVMGVIMMRCIVSGNLIDHPALAFLTVLGCAEYMRRRLKFGAPTFYWKKDENFIRT
jgi:hypothetical protein